MVRLAPDHAKEVFEGRIEQGGTWEFAGIVGQFAKCGEHCSQAVIGFEGASAEGVHHAFTIADIIAERAADGVPETLREFEVVGR